MRALVFESIGPQNQLSAGVSHSYEHVLLHASPCSSDQRGSRVGRFQLPLQPLIQLYEILPAPAGRQQLSSARSSPSRATLLLYRPCDHSSQSTASSHIQLTRKVLSQPSSQPRCIRLERRESLFCHPVALQLLLK